MKAEVMLGKGARAAKLMGFVMAVFLTAWLGSYWFWQLTSRPSSGPVLSQEMDPVQIVGGLRASLIFGRNDNAGTAGMPTEAAANMTLTGIVSGSGGKPGVAVIAAAGGKPSAVREGDEVSPGVTLLRVAPDRIELSQQGRKLELTLPGRK